MDYLRYSWTAKNIQMVCMRLKCNRRNDTFLSSACLPDVRGGEFSTPFGTPGTPGVAPRGACWRRYQWDPSSLRRSSPPWTARSYILYYRQTLLNLTHEQTGKQTKGGERQTLSHVNKGSQVDEWQDEGQLRLRRYVVQAQVIVQAQKPPHNTNIF